MSDNLTPSQHEILTTEDGKKYTLGDIYSMFESRILNRICSTSGNYESDLAISQGIQLGNSESKPQ